MTTQIHTYTNNIPQTHINHQEACGHHVAPSQYESSKQVFAATVEVGELPAKKSQPEGTGVLCAGLPHSSPSRVLCIVHRCCCLPLGPSGQRLAVGLGEVWSYEFPQGQKLALSIQQHLSICSREGECCEAGAPGQ